MFDSNWCLWNSKIETHYFRLQADLTQLINKIIRLASSQKSDVFGVWVRVCIFLHTHACTHDLYNSENNRMHKIGHKQRYPPQYRMIQTWEV